MHLLRQFLLYTLMVFSGLALVACDGGGVTPSLTSLAVTSAASTIYVGGATTQVTVTGYYSDGRTSNLTSASTFVSSNTSVLTVDSTGVVTAVGPGSAVVTATNAGSGKTAASGAITVDALALTSIAATAASSSLVAGGATTQMKVVGTYNDGSTKDLTTTATYVANTAGVVSVDAKGVVTPLAAGTTTITATASGLTSTTSAITVAAPPPPTLKSIAVAVAPTSIAVGGSPAQATVTGTYSDGSTKDVTSTSTFAANTAGIVTVSSTGVVTPQAAGTTTITATNGGLTATSGTVTVSAHVPVLQSIAVSIASSSLTVGGATTQLTVTGTYDTGPTQNLTSTATYVVNTGGIVTVSSSGVVTPQAAGTTTITATVSGKSATTPTVTVAAAPSVVGQVYVNGYGTGIAWADFGGAVNAISEDSSAAGLLPNGHKSVKFIVTSAASAYSGGAFVASAPQDVHTFNSLTFWAKASAANNLNVIGIGDDAATPFASTLLRAEINATPLTTSWTKYYVPLPNPAKATSLQGMFHLAEANKGYTIWLGDIQYENLPSSGYVAPTAAVATQPATLSVPVATPTQINSYAPNTVTFTTPVIAGGHETQTGWGWYTFNSTDATVATISAAGFVNGLKAGTETITSSLGTLTGLGSTALTVTVPLPTPSTIAPTPGVAAANVISLYGSTYPLHPVDTFQASWSSCCNTLVNPYVIGTHNVLQYTLNSFVGVTFGQGGAGTPVDASAMTTLHVDLWLANAPPRLQIQLVNFPGGVVSSYNANGLATGSWVSLEIPLASFSPAANGNNLQQLLFVSQDGTGNNVPNSIVYVDNLYFHK